MDKTKQIELECIFCGSISFDIPCSNYKFKENDNLKCGNCGKLNIYSDLLKITKEKYVKEVKKDIEKEIKNIFKNFK